MLKVIGKGGFGKVIMVKEKSTSKIYAMKVIKKKYIGKKYKIDFGQIDNIITERNILASINHPFLVKMYHAFQNEKKLFFVLEYCPGGELFTILQTKPKLNEF